MHRPAAATTALSRYDRPDGEGNISSIRIRTLASRFNITVWSNINAIRYPHFPHEPPTFAPLLGYLGHHCRRKW
jgi:hypothetical protein